MNKTMYLLNRIAEILANLDDFDRVVWPRYKKLIDYDNKVSEDWIAYPACLKAIRQIVESGEVTGTYEKEMSKIR